MRSPYKVARGGDKIDPSYTIEELVILVSLNLLFKGTMLVAKGGSTFFQGAKYSDKVLRQMGKADGLFHGFPKKCRRLCC